MPIIVILAIIALIFFYEPDNSVTENAQAASDALAVSVKKSQESSEQAIEAFNAPANSDLASVGDAVQDVAKKTKVQLEALGERVIQKYPALKK